MNSPKLPAIPAQTADSPSLSSIEVLNSECFCVSLDPALLRQALESEMSDSGLFDLIQQRCPYLFATRPVYVSREHKARMAQVIQAIESVVALPAYRELVLAAAPPIAQHNPGGARGVFFGYDFHVAEDSFGLIEINTNAGGAMLNAALARAQRSCCALFEGVMSLPSTADAFEQSIVAMFRSEWSLCSKDRPLRSIAIVDDKPEQQYLYPEFMLFQRLFERHGLRAVIAGPEEFTWQGDLLWYGDTAIDMVYNRLTDFSLDKPANGMLRDAYLSNAVVMTPHPQAHALYADKRNLALLSDAKQLDALGVPKETRDILVGGIPATEIVNASNAERLWRERRHLFFKPFAGFGGRAAYRGDKLTRRVWQQILAGNYVAQALVAPGQRIVLNQKPVQVLKFDIRDYTYNGQVQWTAARLYQGQTTNFRTPNGGFAPVYEASINDFMEKTAAKCLRSQHETRLFLLSGSEVTSLELSRYVALALRETALAEFAGQQFILVDWYLRLDCEEVQAVVNETHSWLVFDAAGFLDPHAAHAIDVVAMPTEEQWAQLRSLVFSGAAA